jgi:hypothetical protein
MHREERQRRDKIYRNDTFCGWIDWKGKKVRSRKKEMKRSFELKLPQRQANVK